MTHPWIAIHSRRLAYGALAAALLTAAILVAVDRSTGPWPIIAVVLAPDVAFFLSLDRTLERGRMSPRAVPLYNLLHRPALPLALGAVALSGLLPGAFLVVASTWGFHIAVDRAVGYGLRNADGWQR